jgi:hypothetical protein
MDKASLPVIACELSTLTEAQRRRRESLAEILRAATREVTDLPSGYAFHLDRRPGTARQVEELISRRYTLDQIVEITLRKMRRDKVPVPFARRSFGIEEMIPLLESRSTSASKS